MNFERKIKRFTNSINLIIQKYEGSNNSRTSDKAKLSALSRQLNKSSLELLRSKMRLDFLKSRGSGLKRSDAFDKNFRFRYNQLELLIAREQIAKNKLTVTRLLNEIEIVLKKSPHSLKSKSTSQNREIKLPNSKTQKIKRKTK